MQRIVYIGGPISDIPNDNREAFVAAEKILIDLGYAVYNPIPIGDALIAKFADEGRGYPSWHDFMRTDLPYLCRSDFIVTLPGWKNSRGTRWEWIISKYVLGIPIYENIRDIPASEGELRRLDEIAP
jgi:Domain of unknown function (DUF4406)